jgi:hypothetical protein
MPDPKQKLVKVDKDVISFPSTMEDKDISAAIKKHRSKFPVVTEESEHARQLHPANPLSTAIPHLPKWTQTPLLPYAERAVTAVDNATNPLNWTAEGRKVKAKQDADQAKKLADYDKDHPTQAGIAEGIKGFGESMSTPVNVGLMVAMPESKVLSALGLSSTRANAQDKKKPTLKELLDEAKKRDPRKKINTLPEQPKDALNHYANPEDQPPKVSFSFNKSWSKPGPYATKLTPQEEVEFRKWAASNPNSVRGEVGPAPNYDSLPMADYDVRGHFHAAKVGDPAATLVPNKWDGKIHGNDKFKTPYNGGFSNESMYATPKAPRWVGNKLMTFDGKLVTDETPRKTSGQK